MLSLTRCMLALVIVPSLAFAQGNPPPGVSGIKIDAVKATPMPQGIKDLLVFRGAPGAVKPAPTLRPGPPPPIKGLPSADKLALVRRAVSMSGAAATGSSIGPYMMLSRAMMRTAGRGQLTFWQAQSVTQASTIIGAQSQRGAVELEVYPEAAGRLYLAEWQISGAVAPGGENACRMHGSGGGELTFSLSGDEMTIIPSVFESASSDLHGFRVECSQPWRFTSVEVSALH